MQHTSAVLLPCVPLLLASCAVVVPYRVPIHASREQPLPSASQALLDLELAASASHAATCSPYPWRPLNLEECR